MKKTLTKPEESAEAPVFHAPADKSPGILRFIIKSLIVAVFVPALLAFAGFIIFAPWLTLAGAVLVVPLTCALLFRLFSKKLNASPVVTRVLTGLVSLVCAIIFICVMAGTMSGLYFEWETEWEPPEEMHLEPLEVLLGEDYIELMDAVEHIGGIYMNSFRYLYSPVYLFEDLAAWNSKGWLTLALAAFIAQIGMPQLLVRRRRV
jgi:hypothetical protein